MKKILLLAAFSVLLGGCAGNPYQISSTTAHFNGKTTVSSNLQNLCTQTQGKYALKITQRLSDGFAGKTWFSCTPTKTIDYAGNYQLYFTIVKNDGTGKSVISSCNIQHLGQSTQLSHINLKFTQQDGTPACVAEIN